MTAVPLVALSLAVVVSAATASVAAWSDVVAAPATPGPAVAAAPAVAPRERPPPPVALRLPSLGVDGPLLDLDLHADGTLQVPTDPGVAGWYAAASRPGESGPVVVAGHVDSRSGPGVFARLAELAPGDRVELDVAGGGTAVYAVTAVEQVGKDAFPTSQVYGPVPGDELRLLTCGGRFDRRAGSYDDNVVVHAVRV